MSTQEHAQSCTTHRTSNLVGNKQQISPNIDAGEIIPQALCKSYALLIGNYCAGMVRVLCYAVGIISWPISKVLDYVLGDEHTVRPQLHLMSASAGYLMHGLFKRGCQASACITMNMSCVVDAESWAAVGVLSLPDK